MPRPRSKRFKEALAQAEGLVVVAGGDGTVGKVIAQMPDRGVPVAILPLGSANNIARSFNVAGAPYELAEILHPLYWQTAQHRHGARSLGPPPFRRGGRLGAARAHDEEIVA